MCQDVGKWFVGKATLLDAKSVFQVCHLRLLFSCCFCASFWTIIGVNVIACPDVVQKCLKIERIILAAFLVRMM